MADEIKSPVAPFGNYGDYGKQPGKQHVDFEGSDLTDDNPSSMDPLGGLSNVITDIESGE